MNLKRTLIETLPPQAKQLLAVPYDYFQTWQADRQFRAKQFPVHEPAPDAPEHIIYLVVDALRADHVTAELTPRLSTFHQTAAVTPGSWTFPAVSSMLSGQYPHEHGAMRQTDEVDDSTGLSLPPRMAQDRETLTEALAGAGYRTYGGFGHDTPFVALSGRFHTHDLKHKVNADADDVLRAHLDWIPSRDRTFSFLHLADPHIPVDPPQKYWDNHDVDRSIEDIENWRFNTTVDCDTACQRYREQRRRLYRAAVEYVDDAIERYLDQLNEILDDYLLVITADHGEALWEHLEFDVDHFDGTGCVDHGGTPYEQLARVPLLTNANLHFDGPVSLLDVVPTITELVGIDRLQTSGRSLTEPRPDDRTALIEGSLNGYEKKAAYTENYKLIKSHGDDVEVGYTLPSEERTDIPPEVRAKLLDAFPPWPDGKTAETNVSGVVEDRLEQLGYK